MNNEKLEKIKADIAKTKAKISEYTARLRELERQKTETENSGIIAIVRDMDIRPDDLAAFIEAFKAQSNGGKAETPTTPGMGEANEHE
ncbi:MAG: DUF4315 family protein [Oscillospiraceae bacterium]|nr:DUF4315 family protein [Oscillospiraceae bacterium]